jgi:hypothetical protein
MHYEYIKTGPNNTVTSTTGDMIIERFGLNDGISIEECLIILLAMYFALIGLALLALYRAVRKSTK